MTPFAIILILVSLRLLQLRRQSLAPPRLLAVNAGLIFCFVGILALAATNLLHGERDDPARLSRRAALNLGEHEVFLRRLASDLGKPQPRILMLVSRAYLHDDPARVATQLKQRLGGSVKLEVLELAVDRAELLVKEDEDSWTLLNRRVDGLQLTRATLLHLRSLEGKYEAIYSLLPPSPVASSFAVEEDEEATPLGLPLALRLETPAPSSVRKLVDIGLVQWLVSRKDADPFIDLPLPADPCQDFTSRFCLQTAPP